jgi:hypothetical protein
MLGLSRLESHKLTSPIFINSFKAMSVKNQLFTYENVLLKSTLITERTRRKRSQAIGLLTGEEPRFGFFFCP